MSDPNQSHSSAQAGRILTPDDHLRIVRDHFGWDPATEQRAAEAINKICEDSLLGFYLDPVLDKVSEIEGSNATLVAQQIGVAKSTTNRWPWSSRRAARASAATGKKRGKSTVPSLKQYFLLLAGYQLDPVDLFPEDPWGVAVTVWKRCIDYVDRELLNNRQNRSVRDEEVVCLHIRLRSLSVAADDVIARLGWYTQSPQVRDAAAIESILRQWSIHFYVVAGLLQLQWYAE